ncbi:MAG: MGMT family protein [Dehalococcoidia bacterium]|nr:MGMT family protein [Dehalococcoidia bacterium]
MRFALKETLCGWVGALASDRGLQRIILPLPSREQVLLDLGIEDGRQDASLETFLGKIERYLTGEPIVLDEPWDEEMGTPFQKAVWRATQEIPRGQTRSYGQVAQAVGRPRATRAVGRALSRNPLPILIPCHRVLAADGSLCGFACGLGMKQRLLALEGADYSPARAAQE